MALINVPNSGQTLGGTRASVNSNFSTINNAFGIDHVTMTAPGTASPQGFHNKVTLPVQPSAPVIGANNGIYNLLSTLTNKNEIFMHFQKQTGTLDFPITASVRSTVATPSTVSNNGGFGWCNLVPGLFLKWGTLTASTPSPFVYPTGANIPAFTAVPLYFGLSMGSSTGVAVATINFFAVTNLGFSFATSGTDNNSRFTYFALGY